MFDIVFCICQHVFVQFVILLYYPKCSSLFYICSHVFPYAIVLCLSHLQKNRVSFDAIGKLKCLAAANFTRRPYPILNIRIWVSTCIYMSMVHFVLLLILHIVPFCNLHFYLARCIFTFCTFCVACLYMFCFFITSLFTFCTFWVNCRILFGGIILFSLYK